MSNRMGLTEGKGPFEAGWGSKGVWFSSLVGVT